MSSQMHALTKAELNDLDQLFQTIGDSKRLRLYVRQNFIDYLGNNELRSDQIFRLLQKPSSSRDYSLVLSVYQFAVDRLPGLIEFSQSVDPEVRDNIRVRLEDLALQRKQRLGGSDNIDTEMESLLDLHNHIELIRPAFCGRYFGYRRSANKDEIIRFYINITSQMHRRKVGFTNEYMRGGTHWLVHGFGYCVRETLYLCGHAVSAEDTPHPGESLGLRFFALRQLGETHCLNGLVMSMDSDGIPIAARIVLVPTGEHKLPPEMAKKKDEKIRMWVRRMIEKSPYYERDIVPQLKESFNAHGIEYFLELIRNNTTSVLKSRPSNNYSIAIKEENIRRYMPGEYYTNLEDVLATRYQKFLDEVLEEFKDMQLHLLF